MSIFALSGIIMGTLGLLVAVLALAVGALTSRAEEEYWAEFWLDTPTTETPRFKMVPRERVSSAHTLKRAA